MFGHNRRSTIEHHERNLERWRREVSALDRDEDFLTVVEINLWISREARLISSLKDPSKF
jgi:hypothetical protein